MPYNSTPERDAAIAEGVGLIAAGTPERKAAELVGIPKTTLHQRYLKSLGPDAPDKDEQRRKADERIMSLGYLVAEGALTRMADELDQADHRGVTAFADTASRVLGRLRGWDKGIRTDDTGSADKLSSLVAALAGSGMEAHVSIVPSSSSTPQHDQQPVIDIESEQR